MQVSHNMMAETNERQARSQETSTRDGLVLSTGEGERAMNTDGGECVWRAPYR